MRAKTTYDYIAEKLASHSIFCTHAIENFLVGKQRHACIARQAGSHAVSMKNRRLMTLVFQLISFFICAHLLDIHLLLHHKDRYVRGRVYWNHSYKHIIYLDIFVGFTSVCIVYIICCILFCICGMKTIWMVHNHRSRCERFTHYSIEKFC